MKRIRIFLASVVVVAGVAAAALAVSGAFGGGSDGSPRDAVSDSQPTTDGAARDVDAHEQPADESAPAASRSDGAGGQEEGIGIKGAWVLTVLNADGSVAARHAVRNALHPGGEFALAQLLSGEAVMRLDPDAGPGSLWRLGLVLEEGSYSGACPPGGPGRSADGSCAHLTNRYEQSLQASRDEQTVILSMETDQFGGPAAVIEVRSVLIACTSTTANFPDPTSCAPNSLPTFTFTDIAPVEIAEGQRILVTVTLTFGTLP